MPGHAVEQREVGLLAEGEHERVGLELLELAGRLREPVLVELHPLDREHAGLGPLDGRQPLHPDALLLGLLDLEVVRGHPVAGAAVDHDGVRRAEPPRRAGDVHRRVAAAVDRDAPAEQRLLLALHRVEHGDRVEDPRRLPRRDVRALSDVRADREEDGIEPFVVHRAEDVVDLDAELEGHAEAERIRAISASRISRGSR